MKEIVKRIKLWGVNQLYVVGGNGGNAAANAIQKECEVQSVLCSVVGIPKSIDNDILLVTSCYQLPLILNAEAVCINTHNVCLCVKCAAVFLHCVKTPSSIHGCMLLPRRSTSASASRRAWSGARGR